MKHFQTNNTEKKCPKGIIPYNIHFKVSLKSLHYVQRYSVTLNVKFNNEELRGL